VSTEQQEAGSGSENVAFIFPGQGSQYVGMGADLYENSAAARSVFDTADAILEFSLSKLCFGGNEDDLRQTHNAQPAILTTSIAAMEAVAEARGGKRGGEPRYVAGHSVGEYAALVAAGSLGFDDALRLVRERGRLMQEAGQVREGGMAAILGLDESLVEQLCQQTGAEIGNVNSDGQIVISGAKGALVQALDLARAMGAKKAVPLVVSGAFHSSLMRPAVPGMMTALGGARIASPRVPVVCNTTAQPINNQGAIHGELVEQICRPVQWSRSVDYMAGHGVRRFVEMGPGKVLTGLVKRIAKSAEAISVNDISTVRSYALAS
jgi:[acyl-carrier-protein] S-malonyltransferase